VSNNAKMDLVALWGSSIAMPSRINILGTK
jgi:hypothetical protein